MPLLQRPFSFFDLPICCQILEDFFRVANDLLILMRPVDRPSSRGD